ncbi:MAG: hypothetical protein MJE68_02235, partial [Proteobacteria bacterium]|nr:hypothetical protein [Pseudomonadota bacterium]
MLSVKNHATHGGSSGESRSFYNNTVYELFSKRKRTKTSHFSEHVGHGYPVSEVAPPELFNFSRPNEWTKWIRRFERYKSASGLKEKTPEAQVNTLIYTMGAEAD